MEGNTSTDNDDGLLKHRGEFDLEPIVTQNKMVRKISNIFDRIIYGDGVIPPPGSIVVLTFLLMIFDAMSSTVLQPLLPKMMSHFGSPETDLGRNIGIVISSMWGICLIFSLLWGYLGDTCGRKRACITTGYGLSIATLLFGFSYSIPYTIIMRSLQGCFMGNVILTKAILASVCTDENMAGAMSIIISSYSIGRITGPAIGGFLSFPGENYPAIFAKHSLFSRFVVLLPYMVVAILLSISVTLNLLFLPRDNISKREKKDRADDEEEKFRLSDNILEIEKIDKIKHCDETSMNSQEDLFEGSVPIDSEKMKFNENISSTFNRIKDTVMARSLYTKYKRIEDEATSPQSSDHSLKGKFKSSKIYEVLSKKECLICSFLYAFFSILDIGFTSTMFPTLVAAEPKFGGMGFTPAQIGSVQTAEGVLLVAIQMTVLPRIMKYLKPIRTFMISNLFLVVLFPLFCVVANTPTLPYGLRWTLLLVYTTIMSSFIFMGVVSVVIMFNNSVDSSLLGIVNGVAATSACIGRMIAPVTAGSIFSWSLSNNGHLGFPFNQYFVFLVLSSLAIIMAIIGCFLPEHMNRKVTERK